MSQNDANRKGRLVTEGKKGHPGPQSFDPPTPRQIPKVKPPPKTPASGNGNSGPGASSDAKSE